MERATGLGIRPPKALRLAAVRLENEKGSRAAARELGLSPETFARIIAGLGVRAGSIALAESKLPRKRKKGSAKSSAA